MKEILISVIVPTYKRADYLYRAIDSVLNQTHQKIEVIVVDDNDPNSVYRLKTEQIMQLYILDPRVKYVKHLRNKNGSVARNTGIEYSEGVYLCFLDDDDYYYLDKIEKQLKYLITNKEYNAVYCGWENAKNKYLPYKIGNLMYEQFIGNNIIDTNLIMIEKELVVKYGGWDERLSRNQDVAFMIRYFGLGYEIGCVSEVLVFSDLSDRSNVADPVKNEENFDIFLTYYNEYIKQLDIVNKNAKKTIYCSRYRAVFMNYLKNRMFKKAINLYIKMVKVAPIKYNIYLLKGLFKWIKGQSIYNYEK